MKRTGWLLLILLAVLALPVALSAQDSESLPLEPVTIDVYSIQSVVPEDWTNIGPGLFARATSNADPVLLALQAAPVSPEALLRSVLPQLRLTEAPEPVGEYSTDALTWTQYLVDVDTVTLGIVRVAMAIAPGDGVAYAALLQAPVEEFDALYEQVFQPALDAYAPIGQAEATPDVSLPYAQENVTFPGGADDVTLDGTLTLPPGAGPHPAVVLVSGSGPQDRDETISGTSMKPFALLADALTRAGVAVLRYDDRGVGRSTGDFASAITEDFTADALAAIEFLEARPDINPDQVGVLGHSEGGVIASQIGAQNVADFIISLAGTAVPGTDLLMVQNRLVMEAEGMSEADIEAQLSLLTALFPLVLSEDRDAIEQVVTDYAADYYASLSPEVQATYGSVEQYTEMLGQTLMAQFAPPWMRNFLQLNPADDWAQTTVPVLALFAGKDVQVDAEQNAGPLQAALDEAGNTDVTIVTLPGANHLFQAANTGAVSEYATLPAEFTPDLIPTILDWLTARVDVAQ